MSEPRCAPDPNCPWCLGEGSVDSGGFTPWDAAIYVACGCTYDSPIPPLVSAAADGLGRNLVRMLRKLQCGVWDRSPA